MSKKEKLLFIVILFLGIFLRFFNLDWDQNHHLHPDERFLTMVGLEIKLPLTLKEYFDPSISPLNPYNWNYSFFVYGTLPLNLVKLIAENLNAADYNRFTLVGRFVSVLFETGTLFLVFLITAEIFKKEKNEASPSPEARGFLWSPQRLSVLVSAFVTGLPCSDIRRSGGSSPDPEARRYSPCSRCNKFKIGLWALFFYAISVLPIQLAHFFAVETFLVFFSSLSLYLLLRYLNCKKTSLFYPVLIGVSTGLALACKVTAILGAVIIIFGLGSKLLQKEKSSKVVFSVLIFLVFSYLFLRIGDPRLFSSGNFLDPSLNRQFVNNLNQLASFNDPESRFPPGIQWIKTRPIIFPLKNLILWGLGVPLGLIVVAGVVYQTIRSIKEFYLKTKEQGWSKIGAKEINLFLILIFVLSTFFYQGLQFAKTMRYFYPIYPFLAILGGIFFQKAILKKIKNRAMRWMLYVLMLIYPLSFTAIYARPHSRVTASEWIYENIPAGSTVSCEHWDDCLPLNLGRLNSGLYQTEILPLYDQDRPDKWEKINQQLAKIDYLILSSNRLWGSIPTVPEIYPQTTEYYRKLFNQELSFKKVAEFTSYPCFPPINQAWFCFPDQSADESFTVYDHPQVIIFRKTLDLN
jgi:hypothetical protein